MSDTSSPEGMDVTNQIVRALTLYSLAEFQSGHASTIHVTAAGTSFSVADDGRGHAVERTVAGLPYLQFVYTHLDYPFNNPDGGPVQLQGIGMSLLNSLCSELSVVVRKADRTLRMTYRSGRLCDEERIDLASESTGNTVFGTVSPHLQHVHTDGEHIEQWLVGVLASNPSLRLHFNGKELLAPPRSAA